MIHLLDGALLYLLKQNVLMKNSNNRNVFYRNNCNALFQYRPTLINSICNVSCVLTKLIVMSSSIVYSLLTLRLTLLLISFVPNVEEEGRPMEDKGN